MWRLGGGSRGAGAAWRWIPVIAAFVLGASVRAQVAPARATPPESVPRALPRRPPDVVARAGGAPRHADDVEAARVEAWLRTIPSFPPVEGATLTSAYASRRLHPVLGRIRPHWGLDLAASRGAPVRAPADGVVLYVIRNPTYGLVIDVRHGTRFITRYGHLDAASVRPGDRVRRGDVLGRVGSSGLSRGPHLHFETYLDGQRRDPARFLVPCGTPARVQPTPRNPSPPTPINPCTFARATASPPSNS